MDAILIQQIQNYYNLGNNLFDTFKHFNKHFSNYQLFRKFVENKINLRSKTEIARKNRKKYHLETQITNICKKQPK
jgi:hypothetical protein